MVVDKRKVYIADLNEDMVAAEDIFRENALVVREGAQINKHIIEALTNLKLQSIMVEGKEPERPLTLSDKLASEKKKFMAFYNNSINFSKNSMERIQRGEGIDRQQTSVVASDIMDSVVNGTGIINKINMMRGKDEYTYTHSINVAIYVTMIGKALKMSESDLLDLSTAGLLHDLGKATIDLDILNKPGKLTDAEFKIMKKHPQAGYELLKSTPDISENVALSALAHHEKMDGSGYPMKLLGEKIPLYARMIAVADIYDAMTSKRVYKEKVSPFKVAEQIMDNQFGQLDPKITQAFLHKIQDYYLGCDVVLSNGGYGSVVYIDPCAPTRPTILCDKIYVDLRKEKDLEILEVF